MAASVRLEPFSPSHLQSLVRRESEVLLPESFRRVANQLFRALSGLLTVMRRLKRLAYLLIPALSHGAC